MIKGKNCNGMDLTMGVAGTLQSLVNGLYHRQSQISFISDCICCFKEGRGRRRSEYQFLSNMEVSFLYSIHN